MTLIQGDCLEVLKTLAENSIDALVTDPPAGISFMGKDWDHHKGGRKEWCAWMESVMRECLRVMKPGAHGLVWALPRTSHWTATALEDAGFEIRDCVYHLFGSGFPKSLDVSKAIDKAAGAKRTQVLSEYKTGEGAAFKHSGSGVEQLHEAAAKTIRVTTPATDIAKQWSGWGTALKPAVECWWLVRKPISEKTVAANVLKWSTGALNIDGGRIAPKNEKDLKDIRNERATCTSKGQFAGFKTVGDGFDLSDRSHITGRFPANLLLSCACPDDTQHELSCAVAMLDAQSGACKTGGRTIKTDFVDEQFTEQGSMMQTHKRAPRKKIAITSAASAASAAWEGWGTALKPASEHWILVRKPIAEKSIATNVLKWGTGALNIDGGRIEGAKGWPDSKQYNPGHLAGGDKSTGKLIDNSLNPAKNQGRFPSHLVLSHTEYCTDEQCDIECAIKALDEQSGNRPSGGGARGVRGGIFGDGSDNPNRANSLYFDKGGASRFFYCAKVSPSERNAGLAGRMTTDGRAKSIDNPYLRGETERKNTHPTVKPQKLMRYLCRLVTPPGGTVIDPFMGSGSTGLAAKSEGFGFIGIEREAEYFEIARMRCGT